jgi:uncharacterized protein
LELSGKHIVITGAASGIGRALLEQLAALPVTIIAADRDAAGLDRARAEIKGSAQIQPFAGDLSEPEGVDRLFDFAIQTMGAIDVFFANAGIAYYEQFGQPDWAHIERIFRLNVVAPLYSLQKMRALNPDRPFRVVMTASAMAQMAYPGYAVYGATKAALHRFAEAYKFEDRASLTLVYPIGTRTRFFQQAGRDTPLPFPLHTPEHVARVMIRAVERDQHAVYPSLSFRFALLLDRVFPPTRWIVQKIADIQFKRWIKRQQR